MEETTKLKLFFSLILTPVLTFFEPYELLVKAIGILVVIDITSGIIAARKEGKDLSSRRFLSKVGQVGLFLVGLFAAKEASPLLAEFGIATHQAGKWFCALYGAYELFSILENLGRLGFPIAKQFANLLKTKLPDDVKQVIETIGPKDDKL
jgi:phage-related holin